MLAARAIVAGVSNTRLVRVAQPRGVPMGQLKNDMSWVEDDSARLWIDGRRESL